MVRKMNLRFASWNQVRVWLRLTPQELVAESERVFFSTVADDVYTFAVDASGRATQMTPQTGGREYAIVRVE